MDVKIMWPKEVETPVPESAAAPDEKRQADTDHAQVIAPPPLVYVPPTAAGLLLHFLWEPLRIFPEWWIGHAIGWPLIVAGVLLSAWAIRTMFRAREDPDPYKPTTAIVDTGPYSISRNPIYVSFNIVYVGIAFVANTVWLFLFLPAAIAVLYYGVIAREEGYLERQLGDEYRQYRSKTRRWA